MFQTYNQGGNLKVAEMIFMLSSYLQIIKRNNGGMCNLVFSLHYHCNPAKTAAAKIFMLILECDMQRCRGGHAVLCSLSVKYRVCTAVYSVQYTVQ